MTTPMRRRPLVGHLVVGPAEHGVVRCARRVHSAMIDHGGEAVLRHVEGPAEAMAMAMAGANAIASQCDRIHIHFTDRLFGTNASDSGEAFVRLANAFGASEVPVSVTLHDVPQPSDGAAAQARVECYRRVVDVASGVVVSSRHEQMLLAESGIHVDTSVVPLAFATAASQPVYQEPTRRDIAVLGFLYPGKGHIEALRAITDLDESVGFCAIGAASTGHQYLVDELETAGREMNRRVTTTGFVDDAVLGDLLRTIAVPVANHRHISASGSINTWIEAGRRPLVPRSRYVDEIAERSPGTVLVHEDNDDAFRAGIASALEDPAQTWIENDVRPYPDDAQSADLYLGLFRTWPLGLSRTWPL